MDIRIGEVAGKIWHMLDENGSMDVQMLSKKIREYNANEVLMAVGWLAREGQVDLDWDKKTTRVMLHRGH